MAVHYAKQALHFLMLRLAKEVGKGTRGLDASLWRHVAVDAQTLEEFEMIFGAVRQLRRENDDAECRRGRGRDAHGVVVVVAEVGAGLRPARRQLWAFGTPPRLVRAQTPAQINVLRARALLAVAVDEVRGQRVTDEEPGSGLEFVRIANPGMNDPGQRRSYVSLPQRLLDAEHQGRVVLLRIAARQRRAQLRRHELARVTTKSVDDSVHTLDGRHGPPMPDLRGGNGQDMGWLGLSPLRSGIVPSTAEL